MKADIHALDAYKKATNKEPEPKAPETGQNSPSRKSKVHKPFFENINRMRALAEEKTKKEQEKELLRKARVAAKTGSYVEKRAGADEHDVKEAANYLTDGGLVKVSSDKAQNDSIYRRVAKFLVIIGVDEAAKIIPHLTEEQTERIIPEIASIRSISNEEAASVLEEFDSLVKKAREEGGVETARNILTKAYGAEKAEDVLKKSVRFVDGKPFSYLSEASPDRILSLISDETPGVRAIVLSYLEAKKAAAVISLMDDDEKAEVALRLAKTKTVSPEALEMLDKSLLEKQRIQNTENSRKLDGRNVLSEILKRMDISSETAIVDALSRGDPELGEDLRERLFTEEDVIAADDRYLEDFLHEKGDRDIAVLIYGKDEPFREKILSCVSRNRARLILEEEKMLGTVTPAESNKATTSFYAILRRAWEDGDLRIIGRDGDDEYV